MPRRRSIRMIIEEEEVRLVRAPEQTGEVHHAWCTACGCERVMLSVETASARTGRSVRVLAREVEAGARHHAETEAGLLLLCPWDLGLS